LTCILGSILEMRDPSESATGLSGIRHRPLPGG